MFEDLTSNATTRTLDQPSESVSPPRFINADVDTARREAGRDRGSRAWVPLAAGICVLAVVLLIGLGRVNGTGPSEAKQEAALVGYWDVTGVVRQADAGSLQAPGETLHRLWRIDKTCASQDCTLRLTRQVAGSTSQTIGGTLSAQLRWSVGHWRATFFQPYVACEGDTTGHGGIEISTWTIKLTTAGTITAIEHTDTQNGGSCARTTSEITWSARRLAAPDNSNA